MKQDPKFPKKTRNGIYIPKEILELSGNLSKKLFLALLYYKSDEDNCCYLSNKDISTLLDFSVGSIKFLLHQENKKKTIIISYIDEKRILKLNFPVIPENERTDKHFIFIENVVLQNKNISLLDKFVLSYVAQWNGKGTFSTIKTITKFLFLKNRQRVKESVFKLLERRAIEERKINHCISGESLVVLSYNPSFSKKDDVPKNIVNTVDTVEEVKNISDIQEVIPPDDGFEIVEEEDKDIDEDKEIVQLENIEDDFYDSDIVLKKTRESTEGEETIDSPIIEAIVWSQGQKKEIMEISEEHNWDEEYEEQVKLFEEDSEYKKDPEDEEPTIKKRSKFIKGLGRAQKTIGTGR